MVHETAAIKDYLLYLFCQAPLGDKFADTCRRDNVCAARRILAKSVFRRVDTGQRGTSKVVDDLHGDVLAGEMNGKAGTLWRARYLLAKAHVSEFAGVCGGHGLLYGFALFAADLFV